MAAADMLPPKRRILLLLCVRLLLLPRQLLLLLLRIWLRLLLLLLLLLIRLDSHRLRSRGRHCLRRDLSVAAVAVRTTVFVAVVVAFAQTDPFAAAQTGSFEKRLSPWFVSVRAETAASQVDPQRPSSRWAGPQSRVSLVATHEAALEAVTQLVSEAVHLPLDVEPAGLAGARTRRERSGTCVVGTGLRGCCFVCAAGAAGCGTGVGSDSGLTALSVDFLLPRTQLRPESRTDLRPPTTLNSRL